MHDDSTGPAPLLDLTRSFAPDLRTRRLVAADVRAIAQRSGVFSVVNHGVPAALITEHFRMARAFFALDAAEKREIDVRSSTCFRGYEPFASQTINAAAPGDLKEGFIMGPELNPDHPHVIARYPNTGANLWPRRPPGFQAQLLAWVDHMNELGRHLAGLLALSLDLPEDYFAPGFAEPLTYSQLFHYPSQPADTARARFGAGAHVDWGMLTLLVQDDVGGLEVRDAGADWHAVPPHPGAIVVILGELVMRLTDGRYRSATHRVTANTSGRSRYSMPTFIDPAYDYEVACVPTCRPANGEPRYGACTVAEHMIAMSKKRLSHV